MLEQAGHVGKVLVQRSSVRHVHDLHAPADAERRHVHALGGEQQLDLERVAVGLDAVVVLGVGLGAVRGGVDVAASDEQQSVERLERSAPHRPARPATTIAVRAPGPPEGIDVGRGHAVPAVGPARHPVAPEVVRDDGDERPVPVDHPGAGGHRSAASRANRVNTSVPRRSCASRYRSASARIASADLPHDDSSGPSCSSKAVEPQLESRRARSRSGTARPRCGRRRGRPGSSRRSPVDEQGRSRRAARTCPCATGTPCRRRRGARAAGSSAAAGGRADRFEADLAHGRLHHGSVERPRQHLRAEADAEVGHAAVDGLERELSGILDEGLLVGVLDVVGAAEQHHPGDAVERRAGLAVERFPDR